MSSTDRAAGSAHHAGDTASLGVGVLLGLATACIWAGYMVLVRDGVTSGFQPIDMAAARYWPATLIMMPILLRAGIWNLGGIGWGRGIVLTIFAGPPFALLMSTGMQFVPVSHAGVIAPATMTLMTTLLTVIFIRERLSWRRSLGLLMITGGLVMVAGGAFLATLNFNVLLGDLLVIMAPSCWAVFTLLLRVWQIDPARGIAVVSVVGGLGLVPFHLAFSDYGALADLGAFQIGKQLFGQGVMNGFLATLLFAVTVKRIGPARAAVFPSLVPALTILIGAPLIGEIPTLNQVLGLVVVTTGLFLAVGLIDEWLGRRRAALTPAAGLTPPGHEDGSSTRSV